MPNTLGVYSPLFYANEALIQLEKALGMAGRVYLGYDEERRSFNKGDTVNIRRPSTFVADDAPSTAQDLNTETVAMTLSHWREVKFGLTDKELTVSEDRIIEDHIRPAAVALADDIDQKGVALYKQVPNYYALSGTPGGDVQDVIGPRQALFDNRVPMDPSLLHYMVNGTMEGNLLGNSAFGQWQGAGPTGERTQIRGAMGQRYGLNFFANQNVTAHTPGSIAAGTGAETVGATAKGATQITIDDATSLVGDVNEGDIIELDGLTQKYAVTADATAAGNSITISISPAVQTAIPDNTGVTFVQNANTINLAFHRNAFALVTAPLSELGGQLGAHIATVQDPITGLAIRSRMFYDGQNSKVYVALDVLFGWKCLDPNMAVRAEA